MQMYDSCEGFPFNSALSGNDPVVPPNPQKVSDCLHWQELMNGLAESEGEKFLGSQPTMAVIKCFWKLTHLNHMVDLSTTQDAIVASVEKFSSRLPPNNVL